MRVLHLPFGYYPDPPGGTEVYVAALARELAARGVEGAIAAPAGPGGPGTYVHDLLTVHRFAGSDAEDVGELSGPGDPVGAAAFDVVLDRVRPDVVHMHAFTRAVSLLVARSAKARRLPLVFTYHTPTVSCLRGTLMHHGRSPCDGRVEVARCAACALTGLGAPHALAAVLGRLPRSAGASLARRGLAGGMWTALRMSDLTGMRRESFQALMAAADAVVAVSAWVLDLLRRNGVPEEKLLVSRQGVAAPARAPAPRPPRPATLPVRAVMPGRLDPTKGMHIFLRALVGAPEVRMELDILGVAQGESGRAYLAELRRIAGGDPRVRFRAPVAPPEVIATLAEYDITVVPSQWMETGPLVVLESFAAGVPVLGSRRGGIPELVRDGVDGLLVEPADPAAWRAAIRRLNADRALLARLMIGVRPPRTMGEAAEDMLALYERLLARDGRAPTPPEPAHAWSPA